MSLTSNKSIDRGILFTNSTTDITKIDSLKPFYFLILTGTPNEEFWKHEWQKHGTCAKLKNLNTQNEYFAQALSWSTNYDMFKLLAESEIMPGSKYSPLSIAKAIKRELGADPSIRCVSRNGNDEMHLREIYICFNKELELIDCQGDRNKDNIITNCYPNLINYSSVPDSTTGIIIIIYLLAIILIIAIMALRKYRQGNNFERLF